MVNQAALRAAIDGADSVTMEYLDYARDKLIMGALNFLLFYFLIKAYYLFVTGPERKSKIPDEETNLITAYHEGGHAIVAYYTEDSQPLHKITIMPRNESLGHVSFISIYNRTGNENHVNFILKLFLKQSNKKLNDAKFL